MGRSLRPSATRRTIRGRQARCAVHPIVVRLVGLLASLAGSLAVLGCNLAEGDADPPAAASEPATRSNRLARETSPYLLQHARNPVEWYPWGAEALEKARAEDKPIFLSIGYSSCHWCHVMERKVFSDPEIARYMNDHFICIKIDREERPELDELYMTALQVYYQAIGSDSTGGWPLSLFLTPDGRPLGGGTYFPPQDEGDTTGFPTLMKRVVDSWTTQRDELEKNADLLARGVQAALRPRFVLQRPQLDRELLRPVIARLVKSFDPEYGGFGYDPLHPDRPKFPMPMRLALVQYSAEDPNDPQLRKIFLQTLDMMAAGGIYDQLGGGFHRYSTDRGWRIPHFEKMLYDNAQLAELYVEAYRLTNDRRYRQIAEGTIAFVLSKLTDVGGAFYSALDAETNGIEGRYYVWSRDELASALSSEQLQLCEKVFGLGVQPNFEHGHVLLLSQPLVDTADELRISLVQLERDLAGIRHDLLAARRKRPPLFRDDKIITAWNGLMIASLARSGNLLQRQDYVRSAEKAADFVLANLRDDTGRLQRTWRAGQARHRACLEDYAFLTQGLLALYEATHEEKWANAARRLTDQQLELFWDDRTKGFFFTATDHEPLLARPKTAYDSVLPAANSVSIRNLIRLASISKVATYRERARETLETFAPLLTDGSPGLAGLALALAEYLDNRNYASRATPARGIPRTPAESPSSRSASSRRSSPAAQPPAEQPAPTQVAPPAAPADSAVLTSRVFLSTRALQPGTPSRVLFYLQIAPGWRINTLDPGSEFAVATEITVDSPQGVVLDQLEAPPGQSLAAPDASRRRVWTGAVPVYATLSLPPDAQPGTEPLTIDIFYQACRDSACLAPRHHKQTLRVTVSGPDDEPVPANARLFPTEPPQPATSSPPVP